MLKQLVTSLLEGDSDAAYGQVQALHIQGMSVAAIYQQYITGAMREIGDLWENDEISVADEHLATSTCEYVLAKFHSKIPKPSLVGTSKKAMFFSVEKEQHSLGMKMAAHLFETEGWKVWFVGPNLPLSHAYQAAERFEPDVIGISLTIVHHLQQLKDYVTLLEELPHKPRIIVGSRLLSSYDLEKYASPTTQMISNFEALTYWLAEFNEVKDYEYN